MQRSLHLFPNFVLLKQSRHIPFISHSWQFTFIVSLQRTLQLFPVYILLKQSRQFPFLSHSWQFPFIVSLQRTLQLFPVYMLFLHVVSGSLQSPETSHSPGFPGQLSHSWVQLIPKNDSFLHFKQLFFLSHSKQLVLLFISSHFSLQYSPVKVGSSH